eukprot:1547501-Pyramimonas_sp.AAC.1
MDLKAYVDTTRDELLASINSIQTSIGSLANTVKDTYGKLSKQVEVRLSGVEREQKVTNTKVDLLAAKVKHLEELLGLMQTERPEVVEEMASPSFDRTPDPTILVIRSKNYATKSAVQQSVVAPILAKNNMSETDAVLEGEPAGKRFTLRVQGQRDFAARK